MRRKRKEQPDPLAGRLGTLLRMESGAAEELSRLMHEAADAAGYRVCRKRGRCVRTGTSEVHRHEVGFHDTTVAVRKRVFQLGCIASAPRRRFALRRRGEPVEHGRAALRHRRDRVLLDFGVERGRIRFTAVHWGYGVETVDASRYL